MTRFEFTSVLVSIVLAFGLSEVLTAWGRIIRHRQKLSISWPYVLVSVWVVLSIIMHWFGLWSYREVPFDRALYSFIVLSPSLVIALVCHVLTPELMGSQSEQLEQHYFQVSRWALPLCSIHMLLAATSDLVLPGVTEAPPPIYSVVIAAAFVGLAFTKSWAVHVGVLSLIATASTGVLILARSQ
jgi:hypothetical protein